jgi:hypothetical protein
MPVSTLNKVISLLVIGSLATAALLVSCWPLVSTFLTANVKPAGISGIGLIGFLVFTASALFLGGVIDGVAELFIRPVVLRSLGGPHFCRFFGMRRMFEFAQKWETRTSNLVINRNLFSDWGKIDPQGARQIATAIFFARASKDHVDLVASHHSTYHLATGFVVIVPFIYAAILVSVIIPNGESWAHATVYGLLCLVGALVVCYFLLVLAVERYLYTFGATFRFAAICLDEALQRSLPPSQP